jgi:hypothetical protein
MHLKNVAASSRANENHKKVKQELLNGGKNKKPG